MSGIDQPRPIIFDIFTQPGIIYDPINFEINIPETFMGSNVPVAKICNIKMIYSGVYSSCSQKDYINDLENQKIEYSYRYLN
jgi:hypothetical protein